MCCAPNVDLGDPLQQEITRILKGFQMDNEGVICLGKDGVLRSLTADRTVLSAEPLTVELNEAFLKRIPHAPSFREYIAGLKGLDGTKTPKEKWFNPDDGMLPPPTEQKSQDFMDKK